jgi:SAM-dependent methyltransferase
MTRAPGLAAAAGPPEGRRARARSRRAGARLLAVAPAPLRRYIPPVVSAPESTRLAYRAADRHPWVEAVLRNRLGPEAGRLERAIHADDEMLEFSWTRNGGDLDAALAGYFVSGERIASSLSQLVEKRFGGWQAIGSFLDFGCGFGRVTRFVTLRTPRERIWASDVLAPAVRFQIERLGVNGFPSATDPAELRCDRRFDVVYVGSLFTHLPDGRFAAWFERLAGLLEPGGLMAFTVHDEELLPPHLEMPPEGLVFEPSSESRSLEGADYGSTWVTPSYVASVIERFGRYQARRIPRGLCDYQDLWLVTHRESSELRDLDYDGGVAGHVERADLGAGALDLRGWAIHRGKHRVESIAVLLGDREVGRCERLEPRDDLAAALGEPRFRDSGWRCTCELPVPLRRSSEVVQVSATSTGGASNLLFAGSLEQLLYVVNREAYVRHRQRVYELAEIVEAMKESHFWAMRRMWFRLKRGLGRTTEDPDGPKIADSDRRSED